LDRLALLIIIFIAIKVPVESDWIKELDAIL
jgi:hypothetical protein